MSSRTISLIIILALILFAEVLPADAQAKEMPRIGVLLPNSPPTTWSPSESFIKLLPDFGQALRDLGYVEGQNISFVYRSAEGNLNRLPDLAAELVRLPVDLLVPGAVAASLAAKQATTTIPIVFFHVTDPVGRGLVTNLARPGGNITGVAFDSGQ